MVDSADVKTIAQRHQDAKVRMYENPVANCSKSSEFLFAEGDRRNLRVADILCVFFWGGEAELLISELVFLESTADFYFLKLRVFVSSWRKVYSSRTRRIIEDSSSTLYGF